MISGIITLIEKFKIGSIMNYISNSIQVIFIVSFGITLYGFIRYLHDIFKRHIPEPLFKILLTILEIRPEYTTRQDVTFKPKIRIIFRNDTQQNLDIQSTAIIEPGIPLQQGHPTELKWRTQEVKSKKWSDESTQIHVDKDQIFRSWICPNKELSDIELLQAKVNKQFGTLVFKIAGYDKEWKIQI